MANGDPLPSGDLTKSVVLYDGDGNPVEVVLARDGTYSLASDPRLIDAVDRVNERLDRLIAIGEDLRDHVLSMR